MRIILGIVLAATLFFQNCSGFQGAVSSSSRQKVVSSKVFLPSAVVDEGAMGTVLADGGTDPGTATQLSDCLALGECESNGTIYVMNPPRTIDLPIKYYCSNNWTSLAGNTNTKASAGLKMALVAADGTLACEVSSANFKTTVMNEKHLKATIPAGACPSLVNGRYTVLVIADGQSFNTSNATSITRRSMIIGNNDHDHPQALQVDATMDAQGYLSLKPVLGSTPYLLYKENAGKQANAQCEQVNSPLVVQLTPRPRKVRLTAPGDGIKFDILGENDTPAHTLRQISWFNSNDAFSHYFITLPDSNGDVKGINELFGNNTKGPDGEFSSNGYAALAKYDGRLSDGSINKSARDGVIDKNDEVFWNLRFWADRNQNGIAETSELFRIEEVGLTSLDLNYDAGFSETDRWGNEIKMKSTVQSVTGQLYLMYDIWYRRVD